VLGGVFFAARWHDKKSPRRV